MKNEIQVTMIKRQNTTRKKILNLVQALKSTLLVLLISITSLNNFVTASTFKADTDSNITDFNTNLEIGDEVKSVKISMPDTKLFKRADREINRNMAIEVRNLKFFKVQLPKFNLGDAQINNEFYSQYILQNFYQNNLQDDERTTAEFHAYNLNYNLSSYIQISDNHINKSFIDSYYINSCNDFASADAEINTHFYSYNN